MSKYGYSIDQLMELAGLSVAESIAKEYPKGKILVCIGPGNNGGDGLVAARHLSHFGYQLSLYCPVKPKKDLYRNLLHQCNAHCIQEVEDLAVAISEADLVVDAVFGFSFKGLARPPFDKVLEAMRSTDKPIISVDIPSGWDVENGDANGNGICPDMLVSLTAPKLCAKGFKGRHHYLGGRFAPPAMVKELGIPEYPGTSQCVRLEKYRCP
ncbi:hypothetical protein GGI25_003096 [Coemansia spiralis]|uniref:NAD(P)H-hydrate epimerase n=2 Tax=Coemansia TaxID=4863 RepID=A0A9W8G7T7_9FUNG|nr:hypothetical protein EDC05_001472 [Coemansia umbellata]KAJ2624362.1 hypothetical protein GGI26_001496 [Coemansia sp. RSA 1358]KAJ2677576.1 hypothetical protein GGI25_003096 [Coemansia spiralis]